MITAFQLNSPCREEDLNLKCKISCRFVSHCTICRLCSTQLNLSQTRPPNWQQLVKWCGKKLDSIGFSTVPKTIEMSFNRTLLELTALNKYDDMFPALKTYGQSFMLSTQMLLALTEFAPSAMLAS
ncbi:Hypothetical_protein [Hexamita inflata]|uniref:Hypothetical_protein n=1 Tax=Hexamita inflata TaxID=28002 RepID=A0AA86TCX1_9EUKA|nr:Hypothetical protein HINF_LOCUS557 [Hexamita inflata]